MRRRRSIEVKKTGYWEDIWVDGIFVGQLDKYGYLYKDRRYHDVSGELSNIGDDGYDWENRRWIDIDDVEGNATKKHKAFVKKIVEERRL